uniref:NADH-ubiquinone oxidoreductase chain 2 n=1 Tax=Fuelleborniella sp. FuspCA TaxID=2597024 RepID=A0A8K1ZFF6_9NEOP|nr:NADH dehydrogenase subunit 2 [Fuelleborniella sp. FuspCA]
MMNNLNLIFFIMTLIGSIISVSSINWISAWLGLEINMISFIPFIINNKNIFSNEASMKYFLFQASASSLFIFLCIYSSYYNFIYNFNLFYWKSIIIMVPLLMKLGAAPFHFWFVSVMQSFNWISCYIVMTWQKLAPLFLLFFLNKNSFMIILFIILSSLVGSIGGISQTSMNKIMAFSSINNLAWMLTTTLFNKITMLMFFMFYMFMTLFSVMILQKNMIYWINQTSSINSFMIWSISILSMSGLPPLVGFLPKWMIIQILMLNDQFFLSFMLIFSALITLIFYLRLIYNTMIFSMQFQKWMLFNYNSLDYFNSTMLVVTSMGLIFYNLFIC